MLCHIALVSLCIRILVFTVCADMDGQALFSLHSIDLIRSELQIDKAGLRLKLWDAICELRKENEEKYQILAIC